MDYCRYFICDTVTGYVLDALPLSGEVSKVLGDVGSASWSMAVTDPRTPADWLALIQPVKTMIVAEWHGRLIQGWIVVAVKLGEPQVEISGATLERVTEKVHVRDSEWYSVDEAQIAAEIVAQVLVPDGGWIVDYTTTGEVVDAYHELVAAVTVKSALDTLAATDTGPRWMADVAWVPGSEGVRAQKIMRIAHSFGSVKPDVVFTGTMIDSYSRSIDWSSDYAALRVWGVVDGGDVSDSHVSAKLAQGWHPWETFVTFADLNDAQLDRRAAATLTRREDGATVWEVTCRIDGSPRLFDDWGIGDTVTVSIPPNEYDPAGGDVSALVEGWTLNDDVGTITPQLRQEEAEEDAASAT